MGGGERTDPKAVPPIDGFRNGSTHPMGIPLSRHGRACPGHPRLALLRLWLAAGFIL